MRVLHSILCTVQRPQLIRQLLRRTTFFRYMPKASFVDFQYFAERIGNGFALFDALQSIGLLIEHDWRVGGNVAHCRQPERAPIAGFSNFSPMPSVIA